MDSQLHHLKGYSISKQEGCSILIVKVIHWYADYKPHGTVEGEVVSSFPFGNEIQLAIITHAVYGRVKNKTKV